MPPKPRTTEVMRSIIRQARSALPLDLSPDEVCADECRGCSIKLVEYIAMEIDNWEYRLDEGAVPTFRDLDKLGRSCTKIHRALQKKQVSLINRDKRASISVSNKFSTFFT